MTNSIPYSDRKPRGAFKLALDKIVWGADISPELMALAGDHSSTLRVIEHPAPVPKTYGNASALDLRDHDTRVALFARITADGVPLEEIEATLGAYLARVSAEDAAG
jgi:hypothetical protein